MSTDLHHVHGLWRIADQRSQDTQKMIGQLVTIVQTLTMLKANEFYELKHPIKKPARAGFFIDLRSLETTQDHGCNFIT